MTSDPFRHHPSLRDLIKDPATSFFRDIHIPRIREMAESHGADTSWFRTDDAREAIRLETLASHGDGPLWVFGYGSLMWDPAIEFDLVRRARLNGFAREFCLFDERGGRGTPERPGLMVGLAKGQFCDGISFRIPADLVERNTMTLFKREAIGPAYIPSLVDIDFGGGETARALTFVADPSTDMIRLDLTRSERVAMIATGTGFLGSSLEYAENLARNLAALGIDDPHVTDLLGAARDRAAAIPTG